MPRKSRKGYFVRGQFVAEGSELDLELKREQAEGGPSRTELKTQSAELQALGEQLLTLRADLFAPLDLPAALVDALTELRGIANFEGKRRQSQYVGKLMRKLTHEQIDAVRAALEAQRLGPAADTLRLHAAEGWRERLLADDAAVGAWIAQFPATDAQQLRALVRQARKDALPPKAAAAAEAKGEAPRQGRAFRELFQLVRAALTEAEANGAEADTPPR